MRAIALAIIILGLGLSHDLAREPIDSGLVLIVGLLFIVCLIFGW